MTGLFDPLSTIEIVPLASWAHDMRWSGKPFWKEESHMMPYKSEIYGHMAHQMYRSDFTFSPCLLNQVGT